MLVVIPDESPSSSNLTRAKNAISMANAIRVNIAAKNETKDEIMGMAQWVENSAKKNAKNVTMVANTRKERYIHQIKKRSTWRTILSLTHQQVE